MSQVACISVMRVAGLAFSLGGKYLALAERRDCKDFVSIFACATWQLVKVRVHSKHFLHLESRQNLMMTTWRQSSNNRWWSLPLYLSHYDWCKSFSNRLLTLLYVCDRREKLLKKLAFVMFWMKIIARRDRNFHFCCSTSRLTQKTWRDWSGRLTDACSASGRHASR